MEEDARGFDPVGALTDMAVRKELLLPEGRSTLPPHETNWRSAAVSFYNLVPLAESSPPRLSMNRPLFPATLLGVLAAFALGAAPAPAPATEHFHARDFGAVADGRSDASPGIRAAIAAAIASGRPADIVLEAGTYRVQPETPRQVCFAILQATNLVVRGAGKSTRIVITDPASGGFGFGLCQRVSLRDLVVDYDPVPFCQGSIRAVDEEAGSFDLEVDADYPTPDGDNFLKAVEPYGKWGMIIDRTTRRIRSGTSDHFMTPRWEHREGRVWRFFTRGEHYRRCLSQMRVGDAYVHLARGHGSAVFAQGCDGLRIENVTVHASPGLVVGLVSNRGDLVVRGLEVRFAPNTTRLLTANADGVHGQQNRSGPVIEGCHFEGMADDAVNLYAPPNVLREVCSPLQWRVSPGTLILPGDRFQVLEPRTGRLRGEVKAVGVQADPQSFLITLDRSLEGVVAGADHRVADTLYNLNACGAGFVIRRNHMNGHRRYGCLLRAGGGLVEDNLFEDTTGAGVVLANEPDWPEGPVPWGIAIRSNRFLRGGTCLGYAETPHGAALTVRPARLGHSLAEGQPVRDVVIEYNEFLDREGTAIYVGGATNVTLRDNRITASPGRERRRPAPPIRIENSSGVTGADPGPGAEANRTARVDDLGVMRWVDDGAEVALFGVNYYAPCAVNWRDLETLGVSHKQVIEQDVAHFARMGLTALRLHVFDREISNSRGDLLDNQHVDLLDYLIAQAARRGIYTVLTPIAWWSYGVSPESAGFSGRFSMQQMTTDRAAWAAQARYLAQFVNHTNRFTGKTYRDDPAVIAFELINEPLYPEQTPDAEVVEYINALADAVRGTGNRKPVFFNGWHGRLLCIRDARVEGSSFGWYPSGLVAGRSLTRDFLPAVARYGGDSPWTPSMRDPHIVSKAKIVYEFDAADIPGGYIYPAMARSFRSGGAQIATQFQYDPLPLAPFNLGWQTHYLNLVYAPQKAVSFLIAAEAFRWVPRHQDYGHTPANNRFGPFRVSYEEDLSEMVTKRDFLYSNSTRSTPPAPETLERVVGCGSSAVVLYEGTGAYFLEKLSPGAWRLEIYPDVVWVTDPYGAPSLSREVSRLIWREWPMEIRLPDLGDTFDVVPLDAANSFRASAHGRRFPVRPGVYLLRRPDTPEDRGEDARPSAAIGLREFFAPAAKDLPPTVRHEPPKAWPEGVPLPLAFTVATPHEPRTAELHASPGPTGTRRLPLRRDKAYHYTGVLPGAWLEAGNLAYALTLTTGDSSLIAETNWLWSVKVLPGSSPIALFDAALHPVRAQGDRPNTQDIVPGMSKGRVALRIAVDTFGPPPSSISLRTDLSEELDPWRDRLECRTTLCVRVRALEQATTALEVVVLERDGTPWGTNVPLTREWQLIRVPLTTLRHWAHWVGSPAGRGGLADRLRPRELAGVNVCFGAWLYPGHAEEPHSVELESITVE